MIAIANAHKGKVKFTFAYGASLLDPDKLFNAGLDGTALTQRQQGLRDRVIAASAPLISAIFG